MQRFTPHLEEMEGELEALEAMSDTPAGNIGLTAGEDAVDSVLWPALLPFLTAWPDIQVEITNLYYPSRRQHTLAFTLLAEALRFNSQG